jgi:hypothetical protein
VSDRLAKIIGYGLLIGFVLQYLLSIPFPILHELQAQEGYRRWSGLFLTLYILFQWFLTLSRIRKPHGKTSDRLLNIHKWSGAFMPLCFYLHAHDLGYGYLMILAITFFFTFFLGLLNTRIIKSLGQPAFRLWYITHILGTVLITVLAFLHIWVVFYYK